MKYDRAGDPQLNAMAELARNKEAFSTDDQIALHFALGKAYADADEPERSFENLLAGNALKRSQLTYNEDVTLGILQGTQAAFTPAILRTKPVKATLLPSRFSFLACRAPAAL